MKTQSNLACNAFTPPWRFNQKSLPCFPIKWMPFLFKSKIPNIFQASVYFLNISNISITWLDCLCVMLNFQINISPKLNKRFSDDTIIIWKLTLLKISKAYLYISKYSLKSFYLKICKVSLWTIPIF